MTMKRAGGRQRCVLIAVALACFPLAASPVIAAPAAPAFSPQTASTADVPAQWLNPEGKSVAWRTATESCRRLLAKLEFDAPLVKPHLPSIRRYAEMLGRVDSFDWKTITAVEFLQHL